MVVFPEGRKKLFRALRAISYGNIPPDIEKSQQFFRRFEPYISRCRTPFCAHEHRQSGAFQGAKGVFVGQIVSEKSNSRIGR